jgi:putative intracellular protease/amidase
LYKNSGIVIFLILLILSKKCVSLLKVSILTKVIYNLNFVTSIFKTTQNLITSKINSMIEKINEKLAYVHPHGAPSKGKIIMVASSPAVSGQTGWPIGFWAAELTHPMRVFQEAGYQIELASIEGGKLEMDGYSNPNDPSGYSAHDIISLGYLQKTEFVQILDHTKKITEVDPNDYDAIFLVGGQGPMYTFRGNKDLEKLFVAFYEEGKPAAAVCHSTTLLLEARKSNGELLVKGKTWTGFADAEEAVADQAVGMKIQPYRIEEEARKINGTNFKVAAPFSSYAIQDGNLITGQQQNSGAAAAEFVIQLLNR